VNANPSPFFELELDFVAHCVQNKDHAAEWLDLVSPRAFEHESTRAAVELMGRLVLGNRPIDGNEVARTIARAHSLDSNLTEELRRRLYQQPAGLGIEGTVEAISKRFLWGRIEESGRRITNLRDTYQDVDPRVAVERALHIVDSLNFDLDHRASNETLVAADMKQHDKRLVESDESLGILTGFKPWDRLGILGEDELCVLAAQTSQGKTSLAVTLTRYLAKRGIKVGFVSLEQRRVKLQLRIIAQEASLPLEVIQRGRSHDGRTRSDAQRKLFLSCATKIESWPVIVRHVPGASGEELRASLRALQREGCRICFVDNLFEMRLQREKNERGDERFTAVAQSVRDQITTRYLMPVVMLHQLRKVQGDKDPTAQDLAESYGISRVADRLVFIHKNHLLAPKNRDGWTGKSAMRFSAAFARWDDPDEQKDLA